MSIDWYQDLIDFHKEVVGESFNRGPHVNEATKDLRMELIREEYSELMEAMQNNNLEKIADGAADLIVVVLGTMVSYGIDLRPIWDEVHKTNMAKKGGPIREDGKHLKPVGWQPPKISQLLEAQLP